MKNTLKMAVDRCIHESCMDTMSRMEDKSVPLILTDPPYAIGLEYDNYEDTFENYEVLMNQVIPEMRRVAQMVIFPIGRVKHIGWYYRNHEPDWMIVWYKGSPGHQSFVGFNDWEPMAVYGKRPGRNSMHDVCKVASSPKKGTHGHPCPKRVEWAEWFISRATKAGEIVYDPFCGSGTTGVAAVRLGRKFIGSEISADYTAMSNSRIATAENAQQLLES